MYYQLMYDSAGGRYKVNRLEDENRETNDSHFREYAFCENLALVNKAVQELQGPIIYAVFEDCAAGTGFISAEDNLSGNWRGSKYGHSSLVAKFDTREAAEAAYPQFAYEDRWFSK